MGEKTIPWWRKALEFAWGGFRSGFGFFPRPASPEPVTEPMFSGSYQKKPEEETALIEPSPIAKIVVAEPAIPAEPAPAAEPVQTAGIDRYANKRAKKHRSGAKVSVDPADSMHGLKTVPFKEASISAEVETQPESEAEAAPLPDAVSEAVVETEPVPALVAEGALDADSQPSADETAEDNAVSEAVEEPIEEAERIVEAEVVNEAIEEPNNAAEYELEAVHVVEPETTVTSEAVVEAVKESAEGPEPVIEAKPELAAEPVSALAIELAAPATTPPLATEPEPVLEPMAVPVPAAATGPKLMLKPQPSAEEKAAARMAARQKKLDEGSEESPFSVIVGQVYDGPLDLLLDLIRKQDIDIYDIPIATITSQFLAYVNQLKASDVDVAGEFIYTASLLIHIKSKMLLPRADTGPEAAAEDPRRELVERLLEHERFKNAAQMLQQKQMLEAATWSNPGAREFKDDEGAEPEIAADTVDLVRIFRDILERARNRPVIDVEEDSVTVGQMIQFLARRLTLEDKPVALRRLLSHTRSERALIAMFLALLEMVRLQAILLRQDRQFSEIFIKKHSGFETVMNEGLGAARDDWR
jgi:segregation and condensation protein A